MSDTERCVGRLKMAMGALCGKRASVIRSGKPYCLRHDPGDPEHNKRNRLALRRRFVRADDIETLRVAVRIKATDVVARARSKPRDASVEARLDKLADIEAAVVCLCALESTLERLVTTSPDEPVDIPDDVKEFLAASSLVLSDGADGFVPYVADKA